MVSTTWEACAAPSPLGVARGRLGLSTATLSGGGEAALSGAGWAAQPASSSAANRRDRAFFIEAHSLFRLFLLDVPARPVLTQGKKTPERLTRPPVSCPIYWLESISRISASAALTSSWKAREETRSAPAPRIISCSVASEVTTRVW